MTTTVNEQGQVLSDAAPASTTEVAEFDPIEAGLQALRTQIAETVYDITTTAGDKTARELRQLCVGLRTKADEVYEQLNRPMLDKQALIRGLKKHIQDEVKLLEDPLHKAIKAQEAVKEIERQRKVAAEEARIKALREKIQAITALPAVAVRLDAAGISALDHDLSALVVDEDSFAEFAEEVTELKAYIRSQLGELFGLALTREAETERVRTETLRLEQARQQQAATAVLKDKIQAIRAYPLQAFGKTEDEILLLALAFEAPHEEDFGLLFGEASAAHAEATTQLASMLKAASHAAAVAAAALRRDQELAEQQQRDQDAATERQRLADEQHEARSRELKRQQDVFEAERAEAQRVQAAKDAELAAQRKVLEDEFAARQPKPVAAPVAPIVPVQRPEFPALDMEALLAPAPVAAPAAVVMVPLQTFCRPSDVTIVRVLAEEFDAHYENVIDWLRSFDADAVQQALSYEEIPA
jgi:hypothetical protein